MGRTAYRAADGSRTALIVVFCYGTALAGTVMAAYLLWTIP